MRILFIGGTGTISSAITRQLAATDHELWLLNRGNRRDEVPSSVRQIVADINDEAEVLQRLGDTHFDAVCEFIGFVPEQVERDYRLFAGRTRQYVYISSASAYHKPVRSHVISEATTLANPHWQYSQNKIACEELLMRLILVEEPVRRDMQDVVAGSGSAPDRRLAGFRPGECRR